MDKNVSCEKICRGNQMIDSIDSVLIDSEVVGISYYLCEGSFDDDDGFLAWSHCCAGRTSDSDVKAKADSLIVSAIGPPTGQKSLMIECTPFMDNGWAQESMDPDPPSDKLDDKC